MADLPKAIAAIKDSRPPATDRFTYLMILESHLSPDLLPTLNDVLQDAQISQDIGWDLVEMLIPLPGCEPCLETVARLGNPREVILKVLEVLDALGQDAGYESDDDDDNEALRRKVPAASTTEKFITLLGMLAILHKRIKTKHPSRFLATTLQAVYRTYRPDQKMTASVVNLVHSLSGHRRPALPTRKSKVDVANLDKYGDTSRNAPDPEADKDETGDRTTEDQLQRNLLLSFVTCILEAYVNGNDMAWAPRLLEYYNPTRVVPGKRSISRAFREEQELLARDAVVGQLVALMKDLGLSTCSSTFIKQLIQGPMRNNPLDGTEDISSPDDVALSTRGSICLFAYWIFSSTVFDADQPVPDIFIFPEHFALLEQLLEEDAESQIQGAPGTIDAVVALGLWLVEDKRLSAAADNPETDFMVYHHLLTLISLYHPSLLVRNAASSLAGSILHADPADGDRLRILEDLLENCMFAQLKACAVTWLREELIAAAGAGSSDSSNKSSSKGTEKPSVFAGPRALDAVQHTIFPDLAFLAELDADGLRENWAANAPFVLQAANLALFLWAGDGRFAAVVPEGMHVGVAERWAKPLSAAAEIMSRASPGEDENPSSAFEVEVLRERLDQLAATEAFRPLGIIGGVSR